MSMDNYSSDGGMMSEINVTPLVDVMLVLLTVFIVTAPLLMNAVSVKLPKAAATTSLEKLDDAKISITEKGEVYVDQIAIPMDNLEADLKKRNQSNQLQVEIMADERVQYASVAKVMAHIQRAGISKFSFVMLPETSAQATH